MFQASVPLFRFSASDCEFEPNPTTADCSHTYFSEGPSPVLVRSRWRCLPEMESERSRADKPTCDVCHRHSFPESILTCHRCVTVQHTFCLPNPIVGLPSGRWLCPTCRQSSLRSHPSRRRTQPNSSAGTMRGGTGREAGRSGARGYPSTRLSRANGVAEVEANGRDGPTTRARRGAAAAAANAAAVANGSVDEARSDACPASNGRSRRAARGGSLTAGDEQESAVAGTNEDSGMTSAAATGEESASSQSQSNGLVSTDAEGERSDPGSTITIFCRRDFRRYLRWKRRELANQDDERRREEQTRARKTFSSIIAANGRR